MKHMPSLPDFLTGAAIAVVAIAVVMRMPSIGPLPSGRKILGVV